MIVDQNEFRAAIMDAQLPRPAGLQDGKGRAAGRRFDVYRNNVAVSLTEALETAFPVIAKLVGEANFKTLAGVFLRQHPPTSPLMMFYGDEMPAFLAGFGPTSTIGYLPDIARLELALRQSYHAADAHAISPSLLQEMAPDALMAATVSLAPSLRLVRSPWPIYAIWRYNSEVDAPKPEMSAEDVAILRNDLDPKPTLLPTGGADFLGSLLDGNTFAEALETASAASPDFDLPATLTLLLSAGVITEIGDPQ